MIDNTAKALKAANHNDLVLRANAVQSELKEAHRALESAEAKLADAKLASLIDSAKTVGAVRLLTARLEMKTDAARSLCDAIKGKYSDMVAVFAVVDGDRLGFVACCGADAVKAGAHAGKLVGAVAALTGGKGGGRPDSAMAGGKDIAKAEEALAEVENLLK